jgi:hypothetical protein
MFERVFSNATLSLLKRPAVAAMVAGFLFSLACFVVVAFAFNALRFTAGKIESNFETNQPIIFAGLFLIFTPILVGFLYFLFDREHDDVYSIVRRKLVGYWTCTFSTVLLKDDGTVDNGQVVRNARIGIDPTTKKLAITFSQLDGDLFKNRAFNLVGAGVNRTDNSYHLTIFGTYDQVVQDDVESISGRREVIMPVLYSLKFFAVEDSSVDEMEGSWYDLENVVVRTILANIRTAAEKNKFKKYIDETRIANPGLPLTWRRNR